MGFYYSTAQHSASKQLAITGPVGSVCDAAIGPREREPRQHRGIHASLMQHAQWAAAAGQGVGAVGRWGCACVWACGRACVRGCVCAWSVDLLHGLCVCALAWCRQQVVQEVDQHLSSALRVRYVAPCPARLAPSISSRRSRMRPPSYLTTVRHGSSCNTTKQGFFFLPVPLHCFVRLLFRRAAPTFYAPALLLLQGRARGAAGEQGQRPAGGEGRQRLQRQAGGAPERQCG